jgi:hypothetical protein
MKILWIRKVLTKTWFQHMTLNTPNENNTISHFKLLKRVFVNVKLVTSVSLTLLQNYTFLYNQSPRPAFRRLHANSSTTIWPTDICKTN